MFKVQSRNNEPLSPRGAGGAACQLSTEREPTGLAADRTWRAREKLESEVLSTSQAWVSRKMVLTLTEISTSAGRANWGGGITKLSWDTWSLKCHQEL